MKKLAISLLLVLVIASGFAQSGAYSSKKGTSKPNPMIENAQLACRLARYGYDHKSPTALVEAARILTEQPFHEADVVQKQPSRGSEGKKRTRPVVMDVDKLLADARAMCGNDKEKLAMVESCIQDFSQATSKGAVSGPAIVQERVFANSEVIFFINISGKGEMQISIEGDGSTDLDLDVFYGNEYGQRIFDESAGDRCNVSFSPKTDQTVKVVVKNWGTEYNDFILMHN
jgi:hypothetical protein